MHLYLLRHGVAEEARLGIVDADRALTSDGRKKLRHVLQTIADARVKPNLIFSSHLKRALQTAQFVGTELGYEAKVEVSKGLAPGADYAAFQQLLNKYSDREGVLVVGHNPNLFQFLGRLVTGNGGAAIRLRKGSIARIRMDRPAPILQWLIDPRTASSIYASVQKSSRPKTSRK